MRQRWLRWRGNSYFITVPVTDGQHVVSCKVRKKDGHERFGKNCDQIERVSNNDNGQTTVNLSVRHH